MFKKIIEAVTNKRLVAELTAQLNAERGNHAFTKAELAQMQKALERAFELERAAKRELEQERHDHALTKNGMTRTKSRHMLTPVEKAIEKSIATPMSGQTTRFTFDQDVDWRAIKANMERLRKNKKRWKHVEAKLHARESELLALGWVKA